MKRFTLTLHVLLALAIGLPAAPIIENAKFTGAPDFSAATNKGTIRSDLGLTIGGTIQAYDADLTTLGAGGTGARSFLGLAIDTDVQRYNAQLQNIAANSALQLARTTWAITGITANAGSTNTTRITTSTTHPFVAGDKVNFSGFKGTGANANNHDRNWLINSVPGGWTVATSPAPTATTFYLANAMTTFADATTGTETVARMDGSVLTITSRVDAYDSRDTANRPTGTINLKQDPTVHDAGTAIVMGSTDSSLTYRAVSLFSAQGNLQVGPALQVLTGDSPGLGALTFEASTYNTKVIPYPRPSGSSPYFIVTTPADLTQTASTESIGTSFTAGTRQWSTGALALQRERVFAAPTFGFVGTSTLTEAVNVDIATPIAGSFATFTNKYALRSGKILIRDTQDHDFGGTGSLEIQGSGASIGATILLRGTNAGSTMASGWFKGSGDGNVYMGPTLLVLNSTNVGGGAAIASFEAATCKLYAATTLGLTVNTGGDIQLQKTITAAGQTGNKSFNTTTGTIRMAAAAGSVVLTNTLVSANSTVVATVCTNDATCKSVQAVKGAGTITFYPNAAPTAETEIDFHIFN